MNYFVLREMTKTFPLIRAKMLGFVGKASKTLLYENFLRGQELTFRKFPRTSSMRDSQGRRMVNYKISKRAAAVKIRAYPANFFEEGRRLRSGQMEPERYIITRKLKSATESRLQNILNKFDNDYLQKEMNEIEQQLKKQ